MGTTYQPMDPSTMKNTTPIDYEPPGRVLASATRAMACAIAVPRPTFETHPFGRRSLHGGRFTMGHPGILGSGPSTTDSDLSLDQLKKKIEEMQGQIDDFKQSIDITNITISMMSDRIGGMTLDETSSSPSPVSSLIDRSMATPDKKSGVLDLWCGTHKFFTDVDPVETVETVVAK